MRSPSSDVKFVGRCADKESMRVTLISRCAARLRLAREESGQSLIMVLIAMTTLFAITALVIDVAELAVAHRRAQMAADAGALSAAQDMENTNTSSTTAITDGNATATADYPGSTVTISQPGGATGYDAKAVVSAPVNLPFGGMFGISKGTVTASSVAEVSATATPVGDSDITNLGCGSTSQICTFVAGNTVPDSSSGNQGSWVVTSTAEDPTTTWNPVTEQSPSNDSWDGGNSSEDGESSVNRQPCNGGNSSALCFAPGSSTSSIFEVMDLDGETEGGMWQSVTTEPGARYVLSFWLGGNPGLQGYPSPDDNSFPMDVYITDGLDKPYTPSTTKTDACANASQPTGYIQCGYWDYSNEDVGGVEYANFSTETLLFTAKSSTTTITFNSETNDDNTYNWYFCGPQVTDINLSYAGVQLVQ